MNAPTTSAGLCGLLSILTRGAGHNDLLHCRANAGSIIGPRELFVRADQVSGSWIPSPLLTQLEVSPAPWSVGLAIHGPSGGLTIAAVAASFNFKRISENPQDRSRKTGRRWIWPEREITAAIARAEAFLPASVVLDGRAIVVALWGLSAPLRGRRDDTAILNLLRKLAERVGALAPPSDARLDRLGVPLPGFSANAAADGEIVRCPSLHTERIYSLREVEAALAAPGITPLTPSPTPAGHRTRQKATI